MDSDSAPIEQTFDVSKKQRKGEKLNIKKKVNKKRQIEQNLFEDNHGISINSISQFTINKVQTKSQIPKPLLDEVFERHLEEELPQNILKSFRHALPSESKKIILTNERKVKKISNVVVETNSKKLINHKENCSKATNFLQKNLFDSVKRKSIKLIIRKKHEKN